MLVIHLLIPVMAYFLTLAWLFRPRKMSLYVRDAQSERKLSLLRESAALQKFNENAAVLVTQKSLVEEA